MTKRTVILVLLALALIVPSASAHQRIPIGDEVQAIIGWESEPAIADQPNAVWLRLRELPAADGGHDGEDVPLSGEASNITVTLSIGGKSTDLSFREKHGEAGTYVAEVIPTVPGTYNASFSGTVRGIPLDIQLDLQPVEPPSTQAFPEPTKTHLELEREIEQLKEEVAGLKAQQQPGASGTRTNQEAQERNDTPLPAVLVLAGVGVAATAFARFRRRN